MMPAHPTSFAGSAPSEDGAGEASVIRLLTFSTLFPHAGRPTHGIFVENRLRHLLATKAVTSTVIAPVPFFPSGAARFGEWARHAQAERREVRDGLQILHPRYLLLPRVGMVAAPAALFAAGLLAARRLLAGGAKFDLIDAHYAYPDGVAAVMLGRALGLPVVITARGSDVTQYPDFRLPRRMLRWALGRADGLVSVSGGLKRSMIALGVPPEKVEVLRNGVDLDQFRPVDGSGLRSRWGNPGRVLLSVGHLIERKRHHLAIDALDGLPGWSLVIVGEGPERGRLEALAESRGVAERVIFAGVQPHSALAAYYSAADVMILASSREGWANVLLEAMACGTPVVASNIPGNPEVVQSDVAGRVVAENTGACFAATIAAVDAGRASREETRRYAEGFGWGTTSDGQLALFRRILAQRAVRRV